MSPAKIVVNERTGTIVMGKDVRISPVAILHGNLSVEIQTVLQVSQPGPLSQGKTEVVPEVNRAREGRAHEERRVEAGRNGGGIGSRAHRHRIFRPRHHRDSAKPARAGALDAELEVI